MSLQSIAIIGGTGAEGGGLAMRFALAGVRVLIGSRDATKAADAAAQLQHTLAAAGHALPAETIIGGTSDDMVRNADAALLTVPFAAQSATALALAPALAGKILIDATAPLSPPQVWKVSLPGGRSAVAALQDALGDSVEVVAAFQNVSAHHLADLEHDLDCDVLVCGDNADAREAVIELIARIGMQGIHAGPVQNAAAAEAMTAVLIAINRAYKVKGAGIRITGLGNHG